MEENTKFKGLYEPKIIEDFPSIGLSTNAAAKGETVTVVKKLFITSLEKGFPRIATDLLSQVGCNESGKSLNSLLVIIKPDNKAYVYYKFPFGVQIISKRKLEAHRFVFKKDIVDIISVFFRDIKNNLNPQDGDRIIWLFRENWHFGLFFDLSGKLKSEEILREMGVSYRKLAYLSECLFLEQSGNFVQMIEDGWFPFVALIGEGLDGLRTYYEEAEKHPSTIEKLISSFDELRLSDITSRWWNNPLFNTKKRILEAGISSYLKNTEEGYINAIKNLSTELEGLIRLAYHQDYGKKPGSIRELKEYITNKGKEKFSSLGSLCFPDEFLDYLSGYIFKSFDVQAGEIPESRHSVAHGVAQDDIYNQGFALKLILTLDNIYFFLGGG